MRYCILVVLGTVCFMFCAPQERELTFRDEQGQLCKLVGIDAHNACYTFYYDDDRSIRRKICLKDSLAYGLDQYFYESGSLYRSAYYQHDTLVGMDTFYHETGEIDYIVDGYKENKVNGSLFSYNKDGTLKEFRLIENDSVYYVRSYLYGAGKEKTDSTEIYKALIETNKDTFLLNDTAIVRIYLPKWNENVSIENFAILYDMYKLDGSGKKLPSPTKLRYLQPGGILEKIKCTESGEWAIGVQLDYVIRDSLVAEHALSGKIIAVKSQ